jgi:hypothetical protein
VVTVPEIWRQRETTKNRIPGDLQVWIDARKRFHLSHAQIQMAREIGLNPKKFGKLANHRQEPWKLPLPQFIEHLYHKHFGKDRPDVIVSIEERARQIAAKKAARRATKRRRDEQNIGIAWYLPEQWNRLRENFGDVAQANPFIGISSLQSVGQHDHAEGTCGRDLLRIQLERLFGPLNVHALTLPFFHEHSRAARTAAESFVS